MPALIYKLLHGPRRVSVPAVGTTGYPAATQLAPEQDHVQAKEEGGR
jgi:hypothetical protein